MVSAWWVGTKDTLPADTINVFCSSDNNFNYKTIPLTGSFTDHVINYITKRSALHVMLMVILFPILLVKSMAVIFFRNNGCLALQETRRLSTTRFFLAALEESIKNKFISRGKKIRCHFQLSKHSCYFSACTPISLCYTLRSRCRCPLRCCYQK
jgi:hypothetical protein